MRVTIQDVARKAGVSKATVSYVLGGRGDQESIPQATRERILAAARELQYRPNALARGLALRRSGAIALVLQSSSWFGSWSGFTSEMMQGIAEGALGAGLDVLLRTHASGTAEGDAAALLDGRTDGAVFFRNVGDPLPGLLRARSYPLVAMFCGDPLADGWAVDCDNMAGGRLATQHLLELGHRRILHLEGDVEQSSAATGRKLGYEQTMRDAGLTPEILHVSWERAAPEAWSAVEATLRAPDRPTAVFAWYDGVALPLIQRAGALGLRVPADLSVIGFDSTELCEHTDPPLTSVRQPIREIAAAAVTRLGQRLNGAETTGPHLFSPALSRRRSTAPPASFPA